MLRRPTKILPWKKEEPTGFPWVLLFGRAGPSGFRFDLAHECLEFQEVDLGSCCPWGYGGRFDEEVIHPRFRIFDAVYCCEAELEVFVGDMPEDFLESGLLFFLPQVRLFYEPVQECLPAGPFRGLAWDGGVEDDEIAGVGFSPEPERDDRNPAAVARLGEPADFLELVGVEEELSAKVGKEGVMPGFGVGLVPVGDFPEGGELVHARVLWGDRAFRASGFSADLVRLFFWVRRRDNWGMESNYVEPELEWNAVLWPIPRKVVTPPSRGAFEMKPINAGLTRLTGHFSASAGLHRETYELGEKVDNLGAVLREGFTKRAMVRLAAGAKAEFGKRGLDALLRLHSSYFVKVSPYSPEVHGFLRNCERNGLAANLSKFLSDWGLDPHDLLAMGSRAPSAQDFRGVPEKENATPERAAALLRWEAAFKLYQAGLEKTDRAFVLRDEQADLVAGMLRNWAPDAVGEVDAARWTLGVEGSIPGWKAYAESPHFLHPGFWFLFLHGWLARVSQEGPPPGLAAWAEGVIGFPKKKGEGVLENLRSRLFDMFGGFGGHSLAQYRSSLAGLVLPREGEGPWVRPIWALACLCARALSEPGVSTGVARSVSKRVVHCHALAGLACGLYHGVYIPEGLDPSTPEEQEAWRVQRGCQRWGGSEEFAEEEELEEVAGVSWWYCPNPSHPDANLVSSDLELEAFEAGYPQWGPVGIIKTSSVRAALLYYQGLTPILRASHPHEEFGGVKWAKLKRGGMRILVRELPEGDFVWNVYARRDYHHGAAGGGQN